MLAAVHFITVFIDIICIWVLFDRFKEVQGWTLAELMLIYDRPLKLFFTFIVLLACVAHYPIATLLHHETLPLWLGIIAPLAGLLFLGLSFQLWKIGVRHYCSTGN